MRICKENFIITYHNNLAISTNDVEKKEMKQMNKHNDYRLVVLKLWWGGDIDVIRELNYMGSMIVYVIKMFCC